MFLDPNLSFEVPSVVTGAGGEQTIEAYPSRGDHPGEFVCDAYVVSAGRADQTPPIVSDLILQTTRAGGTVSYRAEFDADDQYTGYTVIFTVGGKTREMKITGAASRYVPLEALGAHVGTKQADAARRVRSASGGRDQDSSDVPAASGGFAGGLAGSSVQGHRDGARDNQKRRKEENANDN